MAKVYLARQAGVEGFRKKVVIKRLHTDGAQEQGIVDMFLSEAALAGQLNHPNVVNVYDFAEANGERFLVMEFVDGPSLKALLKIAAKTGIMLPVEHCLKVASYVCEGLAYAHSLKHERTGEPLHVVHRDITPDNIIITRTGVVKIIDFGIAKSTTQLHQTSPGHVKGKISYIAPEQLFSQQVDRRVDLFSVGVVLYEALTGVQPFARDNDAAAIDAIMRHDPPPVSSLRPDAPPALDAIIAKAIAKQRDDRWANALELQAALETELAKLSPAFLPGRLRELVLSLSPPPAPDEEDEETSTDGLALAPPADDWEELTQRVQVPAGAVRTQTSPRAKAPEPTPSPKLELPPEPVSAVVRLPSAEADSPQTVEGSPFPMGPSGVEPVTAPGSPDRSFPIVPLLVLMLATGVVSWVVSAAMSSPDERPQTRVVVTTPRLKSVPLPLEDAGAPTEEPDAGPAEVAMAPEVPDAGAAAPTVVADDGRVQVSLRSTPNATLFVDGTRAGDTPLTLPLDPGSHRLRFESPDAGLNKSVMLRVPKTGPLEKEFAFERAKLTLEVPDDATVWVDRKKVGVAPLAPLDLLEGTHRFRVVLESEGLDVSKTLELKPGESTETIGVE